MDSVSYQPGVCYSGKEQKLLIKGKSVLSVSSGETPGRKKPEVRYLGKEQKIIKKGKVGFKCFLGRDSGQEKLTTIYPDTSGAFHLFLFFIFLFDSSSFFFDRTLLATRKN